MPVGLTILAALADLARTSAFSVWTLPRNALTPGAESGLGDATVRSALILRAVPGADPYRPAACRARDCGTPPC